MAKQTAGPNKDGSPKEVATTKNPSSDENLFEVVRIKRLVELMKENDLSEIDMSTAFQRVRLRRGSHGAVGITSGHPVASFPVHSAPAAPAKPAEVAPPAAPVVPAGPVITSPIVGTFYIASGPDQPAFVTVGSRVTPDTTVCIIEAMKVFNEIPSGLSGTIREILVDNGSPVEYGQALFRLDP